MIFWWFPRNSNSCRSELRSHSLTLVIFQFSWSKPNVTSNCVWKWLKKSHFTLFLCLSDPNLYNKLVFVHLWVYWAGHFNFIWHPNYNVKVFVYSPVKYYDGTTFVRLAADSHCTWIINTMRNGCVLEIWSTICFPKWWFISSRQWILYCLKLQTDKKKI